MTNGTYGLVCVGEVSDDFEHTLIVPEIFRRATTGYHQCIVVCLVDLHKRSIDREVMATLLGIGLFALKIMDGGCLMPPLGIVAGVLDP